MTTHAEGRRASSLGGYSAWCVQHEVLDRTQQSSAGAAQRSAWIFNFSKKTSQRKIYMTSSRAQLLGG